MDDQRKRFMFDFIADELYAIGEDYRGKSVESHPVILPIKIMIIDGVADAPADPQPPDDGRREEPAR